MRYIITILAMLSILACKNTTDKNNSGRNFTTSFINDENIEATPTIHIHGLTLISGDIENERKDAVEILKLKHKWPLAMKTKNKTLFEEILASDFLIKGEDEFLTRADYINDRINGTWEIDSVIYKNLVLQFFDGKGLLSYRNTLYGKDDNGIPDIEHYDWADVYSKENGTWKILSSHCIEGRVEYPIHE